ncbi:MAG: DNA glycosylase AlkZ-like family protein [Candidatus Bathyarchaeia archaeon]
MVETYSKEVVKEFALQRLRLTPETLGKTLNDVPPIVAAVGGLQYGGHLIELLNRFSNFRTEWFDYWYENFRLIEGHVLRSALRIVNVNDYPYFFKATRSVARRRTTYQKCPLSLSDNHLNAFNFIDEYGPFTPSEFKKVYGVKNPKIREIAQRLLLDLYNYGKVARMGRKNGKPLYHAVGKLPYQFDPLQTSEKEAKKWLFQKCLHIYGPFTVNDVAHWVGWNINETREILNCLLDKERVVSVKVEDDPSIHYICREDLGFLDSIEGNLYDSFFVRVLFNDDALLMGYYRKLQERFGYLWKYPQFNEGIVWRAAILCGRELVGEAVVDMAKKSPLFKIRRLLLRKRFATSHILSKIEDEFIRHANFQDKKFKSATPTIV